jgi:hypothetical protein
MERAPGHVNPAYRPAIELRRLVDRIEQSGLSNIARPQRVLGEAFPQEAEPQ